MSKRLKRMGRAARLKASDHAPEILTGLGIAGMITSTILAVKATPKALAIIEAEKQELDISKIEPIDRVKLTWRYYVPTVLVGGVSVICLIWGNRVSVKRYTALAAAYSLSETAFREYRGRVVEKLGEDKEKDIRKEIATEQMRKCPVTTHIVEGSGLGKELCYDQLSGRYFMSDVQTLRTIENNLNRRMREEMYISANELFYEMDLDTLPFYEHIGWNIDKGYIQFEFDSRLTNDNKPCMVVLHGNAPQYEFK